MTLIWYLCQGKIGNLRYISVICELLNKQKVAPIMMEIIISIICISCAWLLWGIADKRGLNTFFWAVMGAVFGPFAIPFVFLTKDKSTDSRESQN